MPGLSVERLARESSAPPEFIARLVAVAAITPDAEGTHDVGDIARVRLALAFANGGVDPDALAAAMQSGVLQLDWVARMWAPPLTGDRTYGEFAASLGDRAQLLPSLYVAFGLAEPTPETLMPRDEEEAIGRFFELWAMVDDRPEVLLRAARICGEGVRRLQEATLDLFDASGGSPPGMLARGFSIAESMQPSMRLNGVMAMLLIWLQGRHSEHEIFGRVVDHVERALVDARRLERPTREPMAIAFIDLAGYTEITQEAGDEQAADYAAALQTLAEAAARRQRGRVVKLLGDGVMIRYPSAGAAAESVLWLMREVSSAGLPQAHAGVAAGPLVVRDGDVYGNTVNLAARIAARAAAGELLIAEENAAGLATAGLTLESLGEASLKGMRDPIRLTRVIDERASQSGRDQTDHSVAE